MYAKKSPIAGIFCTGQGRGRIQGRHEKRKNFLNLKFWLERDKVREKKNSSVKFLLYLCVNLFLINCKSDRLFFEKKNVGVKISNLFIHIIFSLFFLPSYINNRE